MNHVETRSRRAFTLVELLVVISIVALLVALLLASLAEARAVSLRTKSSANLRGMAHGFMVYAADRKDTLPGVLMSLGTPPFWFKELYAPAFDFTPIFNEYNLMPLTAHPVLGTPRFDDPGNSNPAEVALPWYYFAGANSGTHECAVPGFETVSAIAPQRLSHGKQGHVLMQDQLVRYGANYGASMVRRGGNYYTGGIQNASQAAIYTDTPGDIVGVYAATYDGAVTLRSVRDARWAGFYYSNTSLTFAHYQPQ